MEFNSVFDIIGPIMIGPSSSHTAGAVRIGRMGRRIFGEQPTKLDIYLYGSFATTYKGHGSDVAFVGGALGFDTDNEQIEQSLQIAKEQGIEVNFYEKDDATDHPNTAKLVFSKGDTSMAITGVSIGGGKIKVVMIDDFKVNFSGDNPGVIVIHNDRYGAIFSVTKILTEYKINVSQMEVFRKSKNETAIMCIETDENIDAPILDLIAKEENILKVIGINL